MNGLTYQVKGTFHVCHVWLMAAFMCPDTPTTTQPRLSSIAESTNRVFTGRKRTVSGP